MFSRKILTFKAIRRKEGIALKEYDITSNTTEDTKEDIINENKRLLGQFFTITNPFSTNIFYKWMELIPDNANQIILEPFAGSNNIVAMIQSLGFQNSWSCFDIEPPEINKTEEFPIVKQDTLTNFPKGFSVGITNPPYLAKNSATRRKLNYPDTEYDDLYKLCIDTMLKNLDYVAAIIPESFITSNLFHERIFAIVSLTCKMFEDTECPVCLALFVPESQKIKLNLKDNFKIYNQERFLGTYKQLKSFDFQEVDTKIHWEFNSKTGSIGVNCIDSPREASIKFVLGSSIDPKEIKVSSRAKTRIAGLPDSIDLNQFIEKCNVKLEEYRRNTYDVFLTSFKGLRQDNKYRRRLDFRTIKLLMNSVVEEMKGADGNHDS